MLNLYDLYAALQHSLRKEISRAHVPGVTPTVALEAATNSANIAEALGGTNVSTVTKIKKAEKIAESELAVTAMASAEMALRRKNAILNSIEFLESSGAVGESSGSSNQTRSSVGNHISWLVHMLQEAKEMDTLSGLYMENFLGPKNHSISISGCVPASVSAKESRVGVKHLPCSRDVSSDELATRLLLNARQASEVVIAGLSRKMTIVPEGMKDLLHSVGQLMLLPACYDPSSGETSIADTTAALHTAAVNCVEQLANKSLPPVADVGNYETQLYKNVLSAREVAVNGIHEALALLNAEYTAASRDRTRKNSSDK